MGGKGSLRELECGLPSWNTRPSVDLSSTCFGHSCMQLSVPVCLTVCWCTSECTDGLCLCVSVSLCHVSQADPERIRRIDLHVSLSRLACVSIVACGVVD